MKQNYSKNFEYVLDCTGIVLKQNGYKAGQTIPGFEFGYDTVKKIKYGNGLSNQCAEMLSNAFTIFLKHPEKTTITPADLNLEPDEFAAKFPRDGFISDVGINTSVNIHPMVFAEKLYRGYYLTPGALHRTSYSFFKIFSNEGKFSAVLILGIHDLAKAEGIKETLLKNGDKSKLNEIINNLKVNGGKEVESIYLYEARPSDINFYDKCIKIDFASNEVTPSYISMLINVNKAVENHVQPDCYIGGAALVTSYEGRRQSIRSFMMGLEALEKIPSTQEKLMEQGGALAQNSAELLQHLTLDDCTLDDGVDLRWYHFLQVSAFRKNNYKYQDLNVAELKSIVEDLKFLQNNLNSELYEVHRLKEKLKHEEESQSY